MKKELLFNSNKIIFILFLLFQFWAFITVTYGARDVRACAYIHIPARMGLQTTWRSQHLAMNGQNCPSKESARITRAWGKAGPFLSARRMVLSGQPKGAVHRRTQQYQQGEELPLTDAFSYTQRRWNPTPEKPTEFETSLILLHDVSRQSLLQQYGWFQRLGTLHKNHTYLCSSWSCLLFNNRSFNCRGLQLSSDKDWTPCLG